MIGCRDQYGATLEIGPFETIQHTSARRVSTLHDFDAALIAQGHEARQIVQQFWFVNIDKDSVDARLLRESLDHAKKHRLAIELKECPMPRAIRLG